MVYLSSIYTKTGDKGDTGLGNGARVAKDDVRVASYGSVDELNAGLGLLLGSATDLDKEQRTLLGTIQNDLFDVGADLCVPQTADEKPGTRLRIQAEHVARLEAAIDRWNESLQPLKSFVLPGGSNASAWCHFARTVCRRAERDVVTLMHAETVNSNVLIYLNRLSDLLFVLRARAIETARTMCSGNRAGRRGLSNYPWGLVGLGTIFGKIAGTERCCRLFRADKPADLQTAHAFAIGVIADGVEVLIEKTGQLLRLLHDFLKLAQGVLQREHCGVMAFAAHRAAQVAKVNDAA